MEQWTSTECTRVAAALGTLGVVIRLHKTFRERTGTTVTRLHLSLGNAKDDPRGHVVTKQLLGRLRSGRLEKETPAHPFLTCLRAYLNWELILDCANKGRRISLVKVKGTFPEVWQYVDGSTGLPGTNGQPHGVIETTDVKVVAALGLAGIPLLAIAGSRPNYRFYLPRLGPLRAGGAPADGVELRAAWYRNMQEVPWSEPFAQGARMLYNHERVLDAVNREQPLILVEKPKSVKAALLRTDATPAAWDLMKRAFDKP